MSAAATLASPPEAPSPIHTISLFVNNKPGVLVRVAVERYSESPLYRGTSAPVDGQDPEPPD